MGIYFSKSFFIGDDLWGQRLFWMITLNNCWNDLELLFSQQLDYFQMILQSYTVVENFRSRLIWHFHFPKKKYYFSKSKFSKNSEKKIIENSAKNHATYLSVAPICQKLKIQKVTPTVSKKYKQFSNLLKNHTFQFPCFMWQEVWK